MLIELVNVLNLLVPQFISLTLRLIVVFSIFWVIMKISKANTDLVSKILRWISNVLIVVMIIWSVLNIILASTTVGY